MTKQILITTLTLLSIVNLFGQEKKGEHDFNLSVQEDKAVITCSHIVDDKSPILYVERDSEGDWQFLCGNGDHTAKDAKVISLKQALQLDKTLKHLLAIPKGAGALRRTVDSKWQPFKV